MLENFKEFRKYYAEVAKKTGDATALKEQRKRIAAGEEIQIATKKGGFALLSEFFDKLDALEITEEEQKEILSLEGNDDIEQIDIIDEKFSFIREFYEFCGRQDVNERVEFKYISDEQQEELNTGLYNGLNYPPTMLALIATLKTPFKRELAFKMLLQMHKTAMSDLDPEDPYIKSAFSEVSEQTPLLPVLTPCAIALLAGQSDVVQLLANNNLYTSPKFETLIYSDSTYISRKNNMLAVEAYLRSQDLTPEQKAEILSNFLMVKTNLKPGNLSKEREEKIISEFLAANTDIKAEDLPLSKKKELISNFSESNTDIKAEDLSPAFKDKILSDFLADRSWIEWSKLPEAQKDQIISDFFQNSDIEVTPENLSGACKERVISSSPQAALGHKLFPQEKEEIISNFLKSKPGIEDLSLAFREKLISNYLAKNSKAEKEKLPEEQKDKIIADFLKAENNKVNAGNVQVLLQNPEELDFIFGYMLEDLTAQHAEYAVKLLNAIPEEQQEIKSKILKRMAEICDDIIKQEGQHETLLPCFFLFVKELHKHNPEIAKKLCNKLDREYSRFSTYSLLFEERDQPWDIDVQLSGVFNSNISFRDFVIITKALEHTKCDVSFTPKFIETDVKRGDYVRLIHTAIQNNANISRLNLWRASISKEQLKNLIIVLKNNTKINKLDLDDRDLDQELMQDLVVTLKANNNIKSLHIARTHLGDAGIEILANSLKDTAIQDLYIGSNQTTNDGIQKLLSALKNNKKIQTLSIDNDPRPNKQIISIDTAKALAAIIQENTSLTSFRLQGNSFEAGSFPIIAASLATNTNITDLQLEYNNFTDEDVEALANALKTNSTLKRLELPDTLTTAQERKIFATVISNPNRTEGIRIRYRNSNQNILNTIFDLRQNQDELSEPETEFDLHDIYDELIAKLLETIQTKNNITIQTLKLEFNELTDDGARAIAALIRNKNIDALKITGGIRDSQAKIIAEALENNQTIKTFSIASSVLSNEGAKSLATAIKKNTKLEEIYIHGAQIQNEGVEAIADIIEKNPRIHTVTFGFNKTEDTGVEALSQALKNTSTLKTLKFIRPVNFSFNDAQGAKILEAVLYNDKTNISLTAGDCLVSFVSSVLSKVKQNDPEMDSLSLKLLSIKDKTAIVIFNILQNNTTVKKLDLCHNDITDEAIDALIALIKTNSTIEQIDMFRNSFTEEGKTRIFEAALSANPKIKIDILSYEQKEILTSSSQIKTTSGELKLTFEHTLRGRLRKLANTIKNNSAITSITLDTSIEDLDAEIIADILKTHQSITSVNLSRGYNITNKGTKALADALKDNQTVTKIDLSHNNSIQQEGIAAFTETFKTNTSITSLKFEGLPFRQKKIQDETRMALAKAIISNPNRTEAVALDVLYSDEQEIVDAYFMLKKGTCKEDSLSLSITDLDLITETLKLLDKNPSIHTLKLSNNELGDDAAELISNIIKTSKHITSLNIYSSNKLTSKGKAIIVKAALSTPKVKVDILCLRQENDILKLNDCKFDSDLVQNLAEFLNNTPSIKNLELFSNELGDDEVKLLAELIKNNKTLTSLKMYGSNLTTDAQKDVILEALISNPEIQFDVLGLERERTLKICRNIQETNGDLDFTYSSDIDSRARYVLEVVQNNDKITGINLQQALPTNELLKIIADILAVKPSITTLKLGSSYHIISEGVRLLATALKDNNSVTDVEFCLLGTDVSDFVETFKKNSCLTSLKTNLSDTIVSQRIQDAVVDAVISNPNRTESVTINFLDKKHQQAINSHFVEKHRDIITEPTPAPVPVVVPTPTPDLIPSNNKPTPPSEEAPKPTESHKPEQPSAEPKTVINPEYQKIASLIIKGDNSKKDGFAGRVYAAQGTKDQLTGLLTQKFNERKDLHGKLDQLTDDNKKQEFASKVLSSMSEINFQGSAAFRNLGKDKAGWKNTFVDLILALCDCVANFSTQPFKDWQQSNVKLVLKDEKKFMDIIKGDAPITAESSAKGKKNLDLIIEKLIQKDGPSIAG